jgi:hypothetical protein
MLKIIRSKERKANCSGYRIQVKYVGGNLNNITQKNQDISGIKRMGISERQN